jgi:hypothetical protein
LFAVGSRTQLQLLEPIFCSLWTGLLPWQCTPTRVVKWTPWYDHVNKSCRIQLSKYFNSWQGMKEYTKVPSRVLTSYVSFCAGRRWQLGSSIFGASHKGRWDRC